MNIPGFPGHVNGYCSLSYAVRHTTHPAHPSPRIAADWGGRAAAACGKPNTPTLPRRVCYTGNADLAAASIRLVCDMATRGGWQQLRLLSDWTAPVHTDKGRGDIIIRGVALLIPEGSELSGDGKDPQVVAGPRLSLGLRSHKCRCVWGGGEEGCPAGGGWTTSGPGPMSFTHVWGMERIPGCGGRTAPGTGPAFTHVTCMWYRGTWL